MKKVFFALIFIFAIVMFNAYRSDEKNNLVRDAALKESIKNHDYKSFVLNESYESEGADVKFLRPDQIHIIVGGSILTLGTMKWGFNKYIADIIPEIFKIFPEIKKIVIERTADFKDIRGNTSSNTVISTTFTRDTSDAIKWDKIDSKNVPELSDNYWQHPSITRSESSSDKG